MERPEWWGEVEREADGVVEDFAAKLRTKLSASPASIIKRKNPFLFRLRDVSDSRSLSEMVIGAYLSSSEETIFGGVLEKIAVLICKHAKGGRKSSAEGIDLEYESNGERTIMQIKSGTNWGNSSQHKAQRRKFDRARRILKQGNPEMRVRCVEGCCYGKSAVKYKEGHVQIVGDKFWEEISGWKGTATAVMALLGRYAGNGLSEDRQTAYRRMDEYLRGKGAVGGSGDIRWNKLLAIVMM